MIPIINFRRTMENAKSNLENITDEDLQKRTQKMETLGKQSFRRMYYGYIGAAAPSLIVFGLTGIMQNQSYEQFVREYLNYFVFIPLSIGLPYGTYHAFKGSAAYLQAIATEEVITQKSKST